LVAIELADRSLDLDLCHAAALLVRVCGCSRLIDCAGGSCPGPGGFRTSCIGGAGRAADARPCPGAGLHGRMAEGPHRPARLHGAPRMAAAKKSTGDAEIPDASVYAEEFTEEVWAYEPAGPKLSSRLVAEFVGTLALVLIGVGTALTTPQGIAVFVGLGFGLVILAGVAAVGPISGAHFNPAVTLGALIAGRIRAADALYYVVAQVLGGIVGAAVLVAIYANNPVNPPIKQFISGAAMGYSQHSP